MSDNVFHDHLDNCTQCREHPFDLCPLGQQRMQEALADMGFVETRVSGHVGSSVPQTQQIPNKETDGDQ